MNTRVFNTETFEDATYSLPPNEAVVAAHAQSLKDHNTWDYQRKYSATKTTLGWTCGKFWAAQKK